MKCDFQASFQPTPLQAFALVVSLRLKSQHILVTYLKAKPLTLCIIQIITTIPITKMYLYHCIYAHFQPKCKYTTTNSRHFLVREMNFELKSITSIEINEGQVKV
jgi:hypothetical protein